jgi:Holliday junction resolvasome RuvABC endonuclease subunit
MKLLSLDLSTKSSGFAIFESGKLQKSGVIPRQTYKGHSKDKYPTKSAKLSKLMAEKVAELVEEVDPDFIVIEEISVGGKQGTTQVKSLPVLHGILMYLIIDRIDTTYFMPPGGKMKSHGVELSGWRNVLKPKLRKNGDWKKSSIKRVEDDFGIKCATDDESDAILIGASFLLLNIC